jgi:hypothetical protein
VGSWDLETARHVSKQLHAPVLYDSLHNTTRISDPALDLNRCRLITSYYCSGCLTAHMLKRKPSRDLASGPHVSIFSDDPTLSRHKRKRSLFRSKRSRAQWVPEPEHDMSELLDFVLQHEEAFRK